MAATSIHTEGYGEYISGVILYDETLRQSSDDEIPFVELLQNEGVIPGIKVDKSTNPLAGAPGELTTDGLDGLRDRLNEYYELGARSEWRAVITIGDHIPSNYCIMSMLMPLVDLRHCHKRQDWCRSVEQSFDGRGPLDCNV